VPLEKKSRSLASAGELACRSILHFLAIDGSGPKHTAIHRRAALLKDFCWRVRGLDGVSKAALLSQACFELLPDDVMGSFQRDDLDVENTLRELSRAQRPHRDVAIVTMIQAELHAVLRVLGRRPEDEPDDRRGSVNFWFAEVQTSSGGVLSVVVTMVGEPRNVPCANVVGRLVSVFEIDLLALVGVAAGIRKKTTLGDVVYADRVYDYEHVRREIRSWFQFWRSAPPELVGVDSPRPELLPAAKVITEALERCKWNSAQERFKKLVREIDGVPEDALTFVPTIHDGTIAAGEKLFADGSLHRMYKRFDQRIRAGDQEDSGFAQAANFHGKPWVIFRGICDYGDPTKNANWHSTAGLSAACACINFLQSAWLGTSRESTGLVRQ